MSFCQKTSSNDRLDMACYPHSPLVPFLPDRATLLSCPMNLVTVKPHDKLLMNSTLVPEYPIQITKGKRIVETVKIVKALPSLGPEANVVAHA
jgi:hypothetical protein